MGHRLCTYVTSCSSVAADRADELDRIVTGENGIMLSYHQGHVEGRFDTYPGLQPREAETRTAPNGERASIVREPVGVVAAVVPWNAPVNLALSRICSGEATTDSKCMLPSSGAAQFIASGPSGLYPASSRTSAVAGKSVSPRRTPRAPAGPAVPTSQSVGVPFHCCSHFVKKSSRSLSLQLRTIDTTSYRV
jgi:Aldehyde dehydrogenase family